MASVPTSGVVNFNINFSGGEGGASNAPDNNGNPSAPVNIGKPNEENPTQSSGNSLLQSAGVNVALSLGKQAANAVISNIGIATGNNYAQNRISNFVSAAGTAAGLFAAASNPATFVAAVGALVISGVSQSYRDYRERVWENRRAQQNAILYGFASNDGR